MDPRAFIRAAWSFSNEHAQPLRALLSRTLGVRLLQPLCAALCLAGTGAASSAAGTLISDSYAKTIEVVSADAIAARVEPTPEESAWLKDRPIVRIRVADFPPFHAWDDGPQGISVDYIRLFCDGFGLNCEFVTDIPWPEAIDRLSQGQGLDVILTIKRTAERARKVRFTEDYLQLPWVVFSRTDASAISDMRDLAGKRVAIEKGFVLKRLLEQRHPEIELVVKDDSLAALKALASGQVSAYAGNLTVGTYLANRAGLNNIKVAMPTGLGQHTQAMAVRPDWPELASLLDRFLQAFTPEEEAALSNRWLTVRFEYGIDWPFVWKTLGLIFCVSLILVGSFLFWNRRLQREIAQRATAQREAACKTAVLRCIDALRAEFIAEPDPFKMFPRFLEQLLQLTNSELGLVGDVLSDEQTGQRYLKLYGLSNVAWNEETTQLYETYRRQGLEFRKLDNLFGRVVTSGEVVFSTSPGTDVRGAGFPEGHPAIKSFIGIPVYFGDQLVGEVGLANRPGGYDQAFLERLMPVIDGLGQIIVARWDREARGQTEQELQRLSKTDQLTGLANRRVMEERLDQEMVRAERYPESAALVMLDIDYFKSVNDTYGHDVGDRVLRAFAQLVAGEQRNVDLLARWGGEEFMLLLPETDANASRVVAERIRQRVECEEFAEARQVTVSLGVTILREGDTREAFIQRADRALYKAKRAGRNCVAFDA